MNSELPEHMAGRPEYLPPPDKPYPTWAKFIQNVWSHGISVKNICPSNVKFRMGQAKDSIIEALTRRNEARMVRPSAFLACARQTYYAVSIPNEAEDMPDNIGPTFAVGHLLHEVSYAAIESALPLGFHVEIEKEVGLPDWWPEDTERFNQNGHVDMLLSVNGEYASKYLDPQIIEKSPKILVDFKTMGGYSYNKHGKTIFGTDPDAFGYLTQVALYSDACGTIDNGAIIAGINRDSLTKPLFPRFIEPGILRDELVRLKVALEMAQNGDDPGEEFLNRHGTEAHFQCGRGGKRGFCAFRGICKANPTREPAAS